jgi:hypothetical protein
MIDFIYFIGFLFAGAILLLMEHFADKGHARRLEDSHRANGARALDAFPGYLSGDQIAQKRHWPLRLVRTLDPPDVVVNCGNLSVGLYKLLRVRSVEGTINEVKTARLAMADRIRRYRRRAKVRPAAPQNTLETSAEIDARVSN